MWARSSGSTVSPACFRCLTALPRWAVFQWMTMAASRLSPAMPVVLALARAVADFALASDPEHVLERVMSFALVQAGSGRFRPGVGSALHIGVEQPVDDEERSFDPSDFA